MQSFPTFARPRPESTITEADPTPTRPAWRHERLLLLIALGGVAFVRLWFCARLPVNTGDLLRHIHMGLYALRDGPAVAGMALVELDPGLQVLSWAHVPYSYPPLVLPFFTLVAALSPTLFGAKLALTIVEAVNALLVARVTSSRWLGAIYWASPVSIWWVSGEGQFEPLMALFMFAAVALARRSPVAALALLGLGFHVKLTAILLVPWLVMTVRREAPAALPRALVAFALAMVVPVVVASLWYPVVDGLLGISATRRYNPYYWNLFDPTIFMWNPSWLRIANAVTSYALLGFMLMSATRAEDGWLRYGGAIAFVAFVKLSTLAQFWYVLLLPAFVMPVGEGRGGRPDVRWWLIALTPLLDVHSLSELVVGPWGWVESEIYQGLSAFTPFGVR